MTPSQPVAVIGSGTYSGFASDVPSLIAALTAGRYTPSRPWFSSARAQTAMKMAINPRHSPFPAQKHHCALTFRQVRQVLKNVIDQALREAGQTKALLAGERVRVYLVGNGLRTDISEVVAYQDRNDPEDLLYYPAIKKLHAGSYAQDRLSEALSEDYQLIRPPATLYSASASSMSAVHLARAAVCSGLADVALVVGWVDILTQDMLFLAAQNMLGESAASPFNGHASSVLMCNGAAALLMCSENIARRAGLEPECYLDSSVSYQHSGMRDNAAISDFRTIVHSIEQAMAQAGINAADVGCLFPHGNGIPISDNTETMAIRKIWGEEGVPVVSYKAQIGYLSTCSALVDLIVACDALKQRRLLPFHTQLPSTAPPRLRLHTNKGSCQLPGRHIVKTAMGMEGSIVSAVLSGQDRTV